MADSVIQSRTSSLGSLRPVAVQYKYDVSHISNLNYSRSHIKFF